MNIVGIIKSYLSADQPLLTNFATMVALMGAFYALLHYVWKGVRWVYGYFTRMSLYRRLNPYFSKEEILLATENYIPTRCQIVDPAVAAEPVRVDTSDRFEKLIPFFITKFFNEKKLDKYHLVLADSGMGKTTFMINLFLKYMRKHFKPFAMRLLPLGHPDTDGQIDAITNKSETILLLDAFDDDIGAEKDYRARMQEIISKTSKFLAVIITSRTQFFPSDPDIPEETGLYKFGGNKGMHRFYRMYVSPFNTKDINHYLRRKYPIYRLKSRRKAHFIVEKSLDLMVRPMLLANIEDFVKSSKIYETSCDIFEEMVERWIQRERVENKKELRRFSEIIARDMYENQQTRGGLYIGHEKIDQFAQKHQFQLDELDMRSRSLLNRIAEGKYKFAHKSILEYLLSVMIIRDPSFCRNFNFNNMEQARRFYMEQYLRNLRELKGYFQLLVKKGSVFTVNTQPFCLEKLPLKGLEMVASLDLKDKQISDILPLTEFRNIRHLFLSNNQITDISPLIGLKDIEKLSLDNNQVNDISPLMQLKDICELDLSSNQISDISPLTELKNIELLYLDNNQITDLLPLKAVGRLKYLRLAGNPIGDKSVMDELRMHGVKIWG